MISELSTETTQRKNILSRISDIIESILSVVSIVLTIGLVVNMVVAVFFRYVLSKPIFWADELSLILFVWITFLGGCLALKKAEMPAVTLLFDKLTPMFQLILSFVIQFTVLAFSVILGYFSYLWIISPSVVNMISATLRINMWWIYLIVPISMLCMIVFSISIINKSVVNYLDARKEVE